MIRPTHIFCTTVALAIFLSPLAPHAVAVVEKQKFVPPENRVLLIIGQDRQAIENYIKKTNVIPAGFTFYTSIQKMDGLDTAADHGGGEQHASHLLRRYPFEVVQIGLYMVGALEGVTRGDYDENIKVLANWIKRSGKLVYLRIGYEFDNPQNRYRPAQYKAAYHYIADELRRLRVKNVAFVWHSYASLSAHPLAEWYPGDEYVDWAAISYYNPYNTDNMDKVVAYAQKRNKPVMIAEAAPIKMGAAEGEERWRRWYAFVFDYIRTRDIRAFSYINCDWDQLPLFVRDQWGDSRIEKDGVVRTKWVETIQGQEFMNHSPRLKDFVTNAKLSYR